MLPEDILISSSSCLIPLMNSLNKTEAANFPCKLMLPEDFPVSSCLIPLINSFNKTEAANFPCTLMLPVDFSIYLAVYIPLMNSFNKTVASIFPDASYVLVSD